MDRIIKITASLLLGAAFCYLAFRNVDFAKVMAVMSGVKAAPLAAAVLLFLFTQGLRAERWRRLLAPDKYGFWGMFKVFMIGVFANYSLPARLGEFSRPVVMKKVYGVGMGRTLGLIVVERIFDLIGQVCLFAFVSIFVPMPGYLRTAGVLISVLILCVISSLFVVRYKTGLIEGWIVFFAGRRAPGLSERIVGALRTFAGALDVVRDFKTAAITFIYTLASWWLSAGVIMLAMMSMGIKLDSMYISACFVQVALSLALVIPPPPGFIGTFHYFCKEGLMFYGVSAETALSFAVLFHGLQIVLISLLGTAFLISLGLGLRALVESGGPEKNGAA